MYTVRIYETVHVLIEPVYRQWSLCEAATSLLQPLSFRLQVTKPHTLHTSLKQPPPYYNHGLLVHDRYSLVPLLLLYNCQGYYI